MRVCVRVCVCAPTQVTFYALRWLFAYLLLDAYTRTLHFNAIAKYGLLTRGVLQYHGLSVTPVDYAYTAIVVLLFMWLKVTMHTHPHTHTHTHTHTTTKKHDPLIIPRPVSL